MEKLALARIRWHAEIGNNGFDRLPDDDAAWNARQSLSSIVQILDDLDHANSLAEIFRVTGVEPRFNRKGGAGL